MTPQANEHEDPALKSAIRRAVGQEAAPARLRARVEMLLGESQMAAAHVKTPSRWRIGLAPEQRKLAAAAAVAFVAMGFAAYQVKEELFPMWGSPQAAVRVIEFPISFATSLTRTHDNCAKLADHHLVPGDDLGALRKKLSEDEGFEVFAGEIGDGWTFKGAGECQIESVKAAHLVFVKGDDVVSIFSMQSLEMCGGDSYAFEQTYDNHPIATVRNGAVTYSVVGSSTSEITLADIRPVLGKVEQLMCPNRCLINPTATAPVTH